MTFGRGRQMNGWTQGPIRRRTDEMRAEGLRTARRRAGRGLPRLGAGLLAAGAVCGLAAGNAHADESNRGAHNGPRIGLVNTGQIDDPMEDVLEHFLLVGDGYTWS